MSRGRKSCPQCNASVGPRLRVCECGHEFTFKTKPEPPRRTPPKIPPKVSLPQPDEHGKRTVVVNDEPELRRFIAALKDAANKCRHSGGGYSVFLHLKDGTTLQIDIQFPYKLP